MSPNLSDILTLNDTQEIMAEDFEEISTSSHKDIAIIGLAMKLPGADSLESFWENTSQATNCIRNLPEIRKNDANRYIDYCKPQLAKEYAKIAYLNEIDKFDYRFFNLAPKEAKLLDPNQRLFLETVWQAVEDAGYGGDKLVGTKTGVYIGFRGDDYYNYRSLILDVEPNSAAALFIPNLNSIMAGRISYLLDLKGPSMVVDTACSSSLVAVHLACQAIRHKECEMAIAGGVRINILPLEIKDKLGIESSDGKARTFDDAADGTGIGEGVVALVLKPLHRALRDNDHVYAVIKGSATNQDGSSVGLTAPNVLAQEEVIVQAWKDAEVDPETITYIEAHGTGTKLGDPIEIDGIQRAFLRYTTKKQFCAIGSVKTKIGHLDNLAGVAGLVQAIAALQYQKLPPSFHFNKPNQRIAFENSPVYVNNRPSDWEVHKIPRRCGISSFGLSGTNCHIILEEAPQKFNGPSTKASEWSILTLSAKNEKALQSFIELYRKLDIRRISAAGFDIADICFTANSGRGHYEYRLVVIGRDWQDFQAALNQSGLLARDARASDIPGDSKIYYGYHKIIADNKKIGDTNTVTDSEIRRLSREAAEKMAVFLASGKTDITVLQQIGALYVKGAKVDWNGLYQGEQRRRLSLPVYPFERNRCWIDIPEPKIAVTQDEISRLLYEMRWEQETLPPEPDQDPAAETLVIFKGTSPLSDQIMAYTAAHYREVVTVSIGPGFQALDGGHFVIANQEQDYYQLLVALGDRKISAMLHLFTLDGASNSPGTLAELENSQKSGIYSLFYLAKALGALKVKPALQLVLAAPNVNEVTGDETRLHPEHATLFGFGKAMTLEFPNCKCSYLDIDEATKPAVLIAELRRPGSSMIAYRHGVRYVEKLSRFSSESLSKRNIGIKEGGVYLITGGTGGVGLALGKYLAAQQPVNLVLIGRSALPPRAQWDSIIQQGAGQKLSQRIAALQEIEAKGSHVDLYAIDVAVEQDLKTVWDQTKQKFGKIDGIIHCAGVAGSGLIANQSEGQLTGVLSPKMNGAWLLSRFAESEPLDFLIMFSSLVSIAGTMGMSGYVAANSFLDSYAAYCAKKHQPALTINWTVWNRTGMAENIDTLRENAAVFQGISAAEAVKVLATVLPTDRSGIAVGDFNYANPAFKSIMDGANIRLTDELRREVMERIQRGTQATGRTRPESAGSPEDLYASITQRLMEIWRQNLGYAEIGVHDNFFEIGGDSLKINQIFTALETEFPGKVTTADLFLYPTISELAEHIAGSEPGKPALDGAGGDQALEKQIADLLNGDSQVAADGVSVGSSQPSTQGNPINLSTREEIETTITQIWRDKLGYDQINPNDNFFEIGGDSITLNKIFGLLEEVFPGRVTVADLFLYPSIAELAEFIHLGANPADETIDSMPSDETDQELEDRIAKLLND